MTKLPVIRTLQSFLSKHSTGILTGLGIGGMVTGTVLAVRATPGAMERMERKKKEEDKKKLSPLEIVQATWKCYIPAAATEAVSVVCILGANSIHSRRNAALAAAYTMTETAFQTYQDKVIETVGEKKETEIQDAIAKDQVAKVTAAPSDIYVTGYGNTLCLDIITNQLFYSDINKIRQAENEVNRRMIGDMYASLNEFYDELGLPEMDPRVGDELGWNINKGRIELEFSSQLTQRGEPCLVLRHVRPPCCSYRNY